MALQMAQAIADLHGYKDGVIIHNDIQVGQFLLDEDNRVKLSDFNRAEPRLWDEEKGEYCKYCLGAAMGNVRSPEEYAQEDIDEKIDVYSFGNILYALLTGLDAYAVEEYKGLEIRDLSVEGVLPHVDLSIRGRSFADAALASVMDRCFEYNPSFRTDIFTVVSLLKDAVVLNKRFESVPLHYAPKYEVTKLNKTEEEGYSNDGDDEAYYGHSEEEDYSYAGD
eukprot:CAMPEP_0197241594 /NCGR_PEP_ID=MMETSP1429-20130617/7589_1 /TAXON_ID=49237 /ORGANISM="Chaetoceros  sp., Strain UNC1202" /LENGTH=222 /DNA_ID=CAMNT_0042701455 /DNA_START=20 /DNA_END=688 /DNA_ORIENTATION=-